ncbi:hypothetical protein LCGC14_1151370 [marine sediment metagenome]|uniref:ABC transporter domain-containing protein n=1 Tax=marine sediment metagenome TaxID=412755 RepID=A0A0F9PDI8_9ZZZZ|nr:ABC transporter ATP-binding protein [Desulfobacterales bacterium]
MTLQVTDVFASYGPFKVLKSVSIEVKPEQCISVIGQNGAGKSTLLRAILGLLGLESGQVTFEGKDITNLSPWERAKIGLILVPEGRHIFGPLTVYENLSIGCVKYQRKKRLKKRLDFVYELFPFLQQRENQTSATLSGGEQQMLAIARALMAQPKLMLLDEPSLGLSPVMIEALSKTLEEVKRTSSLLLVEQNVRLALNLAEKMYMLHGGQVVFQGTDKEFESEPKFLELYFG